MSTSLDLNEVLGDWECPRDEVAARLVAGRDGEDLVQLRVDLGILQMFLAGRPDGMRYRGMPTAWEHIEHEQQIGGVISDADWQELQRELQQYNYRRLALSSLTEDAFRERDFDLARRCLRQTLRDIEQCVAILTVMESTEQEWDDSVAQLFPALVFNRARLMVRMLVSEQRYDQAIEEATAGASQLDQALGDLGLDDEQRHQDPGIAYLAQMGQRLRDQFGITQTLQEKLEAAIEAEQFEAAARLRDELRRRDGAGPSLLPSPSPEEQ